MRKFYAFLFFSLFIFSVNARNGVTYQLLKNGQKVSNASIERVINSTILERYRLISEDRTYKISGTEYELVIFSASYLASQYNRHISPLNLRDPEELKGLHFVISDGRVLKPQR